MGKLIVNVVLYLLVRSFVFLLTISLLFKDVKVVKLSDLNDKEDWLMFLWLFFVSALIEVIVLTFPFVYGLSRQDVKDSKLYYLFFALLFLVEFIISHWLIGMRYPFIKILISLVLFLVVFRKRLPLLA